MARAPFNVLAIPYRLVGDDYQYAVFHRQSCPMWQFVAGGGEDGETPIEAAQRETLEEAGVDGGVSWIRLDSTASVPRTAFPGAPWPANVYVIPEYCFAVDVEDRELRLSCEHDKVEWLDYSVARDRLTWDSNRTAMWELRERLPK
jgi:dATP pyrophosphohydrolase